MNRRQVSALLVLKELGITHQMDSFSDRLSVQKSVYLAQAIGVDVGHYFSWYLRGPYAPSLTQDIFEAIQGHDAGAATRDWELDPKTRAKLSKLRGSFNPPSGLGQPMWLELLASVHFLFDRHQLAKRDAESVTAQLKKSGKSFTTRHVADALRRLAEVGLVSQPEK